MNNVFTALVAARKEFPPIEADASADAGRKGKYKYVTLAHLLASVSGPLLKHGLVLTQRVCDFNGEVNVLGLVTDLYHAESGESITSGKMPVIMSSDHKETGGALSYARRYQLIALLGIAPGGETDGEEAAPPPPPARYASHSAPPPPPPPPQDEDFGMGEGDRRVRKAVSEMWGNPFYALSNDEEVGEFVVEVRGWESESDRPMPTTIAPGKKVSMYGYLCSLIDQHTEKEAHGIVLSYLIGRVISAQTPPMMGVRRLIDELNDSDRGPATVSLIKRIHEQVKREVR